MALDILIVDDSAAIRKILSRVIGQTDLTIGELIEAGDGVAALKVLKSRHIDLVLSDINMPNMDGIQLLNSVRSRSEWDKIPVIMITTEGGQEKVMETAKAGAQGYVRKPFTPEQIKEKISSCLGELGK